MDWQPIETAPQDGTKIWGWLYDTGIHLMQWMSGDEIRAIEDDGGEPDEFEGGWYKSNDLTGGDWNLKFWLPAEAISYPNGVAWVYDGPTGCWRDICQKPEVEIA